MVSEVALVGEELCEREKRWDERRREREDGSVRGFSSSG